MNHLVYVTHLQDQYDPQMAKIATTALEFTVPHSGHVLLMAQATALCDDTGDKSHKVGVVFTLFDDKDAPKADATGYVKGLNPGHATVCMTYLTVSGLPPGSVAKITIDRAPGSYGNGGIGPEDYFSVAVVELEQITDPEGHGA